MFSQVQQGVDGDVLHAAGWSNDRCELGEELSTSDIRWFLDAALGLTVSSGLNR
jgi:hypothetical protein